MEDRYLDLPSEFSFGQGLSIVLPEYPPHEGREDFEGVAIPIMRSLANAALASRQWENYVFYHARLFRWRALLEIAPEALIDGQLGYLFRKVWIDSEHIWNEKRTIRRILTILEKRPRQQRQIFTRDDWKVFKALPERFTVYRGAKDWNTAGMSWTRDPRRAVYFATHHDEDVAGVLPESMAGFVMECTVRKSSVLFYTNDRNEDEIILKRAARGRVSPEGMLWVAETLGTERFAAEFEKQREHLSAETVHDALNLLSAIRQIAGGR